MCQEAKGMVRLQGCQCCGGKYICCPSPCCEGNPRNVEWGEKCGSIEWTDDSRPPKVDIYLAIYEDKPMVKIEWSPEYAEKLSSQAL